MTAVASPKPLTNCAVLLSSSPLTCTAKADTHSNETFFTSTHRSHLERERGHTATDLQWLCRTFVDEPTEDLVVIESNDIFFSRAALVANPEAVMGRMPGIPPERFAPDGPRSGSKSSLGDSEGGGDRPSRFVDVCYLRAPNRATIAATRTVAMDDTTIVACMHDETHLKFYAVAPWSPTTNVEQLRGKAGGSNLDRESAKDLAVTQPFATYYSTSSKPPPFGGRQEGVIRQFFWLPGVRSAATPTSSSPGDAASAQTLSEDSSATPVPASYLMVISEHAITMIAVSAAQRSVSTVCSLRTTCDYAAYHPGRRFLVVLNEKRPGVCKCFAIGKPGPDALKRLPEFAVESSNSPDLHVRMSTAHMHPLPMEHRLTIPLVVYGHTFVLDTVSSRNELHLYHWFTPGNILSSDPELYTKVERRFVLLLPDDVWPIQVQVVDNIIVIHQRGKERHCLLYDIKLHPPKKVAEQYFDDDGKGTRASGRGRPPPIPICAIKTNVSRTKEKIRKLLGEPIRSPTASALTSEASEGLSSPPEPPLSLEAATNPAGWGTGALAFAATAATTAWSALFGVSWGPTAPVTGTMPSLVLPVMFPLPVKTVDLWFEAPCGGVGVPSALSAVAGSERAPNEAAIRDLEFYSGRNLPIALDRATGEVLLVMLQPAALARVFGDRCLCTQFLVHRTGLGGDVIPTMLKEMTVRREPLHTIGVIFGSINEQRYEHAVRVEASKGQVAGTSRKKSAPRPYGFPVAAGVYASGADRRKLNEVFPMSDLQQDTRTPFRYEDAVWSFRGPSENVAVAGRLSDESAPVQADSQSRDEVRSASDDAHSDARHFVIAPSSFHQARVCSWVLQPLLDYGGTLMGASRQERHVESPPAAKTREELGDDPRSETPGSIASGNGNSVSQAAEFFQYFLFVLLEYCRTLRQHQQSFSPQLQSILIDVFVELANLGTPQFYRLQQLLMYRAIDSHESVALKLVRLSQHYPPALQHALDMLTKLNNHAQIVRVLLSQRLPLRAINYALQRSVAGVSLSEVLRSALEVDNAVAAEEEEAAEWGGHMIRPKRTVFLTAYQLVQQYIHVLPATAAHGENLSSFDDLYRRLTDQQDIPMLF